MTFVEIMASATREQRADMLARIMRDGYSQFTAAAYFNGDRSPKFYYKTQLQKHVRQVFRQDIPLELLFPARRED